MRDYGKVSPQFWIGETGKQLRGDANAQLLALYLMTCPHSTMTGVFHCPILYMAHETGMGIEGATKALARLSEVGFCEYEEASETVFVVRMAAYQIGESLKQSDNRVMGLRKEVERMPETRAKSSFLAVYGLAFGLVDAVQDDRGSQAPSETLRSQEQEQEQEQEQTFCASADARGRPKLATTSEGFERFWSAYPRKVSKGRAQKAWAKLKPSEQLVQAIIAGIGRAKTSAQWTREGGQYIPHPATWLNDRGWEDEQPATAGASGQWWLAHGHGTRDAAIAAGMRDPTLAPARAFAEPA